MRLPDRCLYTASYGIQAKWPSRRPTPLYVVSSVEPFVNLEKCTVDDHRTQNLNIYCRTCQVLTCTLCKCFGKHQKCHVIPLRLFFKMTHLTSDWSRVLAVIWKTLPARRIKKISTASKLFWRNFGLRWIDILLLLTFTMNLFREMAIRKWLIDCTHFILVVIIYTDLCLCLRLWHSKSGSDDLSQAVGL